ncbi:O-acetyl-ADP-ribose deacetylase [Oceanobacillus halophilus]|uniref:O-acetyl-ADP-ribose deacetylase n=1 Tax=Oceanobacillus halophilus TaxID=930130 RepID=A0A494ZTV5_9BACI|nr:O-acetyl-ADP-ribose deacetylase [Oceanobacillus halophilus]RKQ29660.1 O-acetyl-ADP-ribose deacetylase [Oceanobacillus halophilus]
MKIEINGNSLELMIGDITKQSTEAIVNAANGTLMGGGGVDGAIHQAAGSDLVEECKKIREEDLDGNYLRTGKAVITKGYNLPAKFVIHTVGPVWDGNKQSAKERLVHAYNNSLKLAMENRITSVSFPSISTGVYRYPVQLASVVAINAIIDFLQNNTFGKVVLTLFSEKDYQAYEDALKKKLSNLDYAV